MKKKIMKIDEDTLELTEVEIDVPDEEIKSATVEEVDDAVEQLREALEGSADEFYTKYRVWKEAEKEFKDLYEPMKSKIIELHDKQELPKNIVIGDAKLTYVSPSIRTSIDNKKLKEEEPEIAKKYTKTTRVGATVRIEDLKK